MNSENTTPTTEETRNQNREFIIRNLESRIEGEQNTVDRFKATFESDPLYACEWGHGVFEAVALISVYKKVVEMLRESGIDLALDTAKREAMHSARYPSFSTSVTSNLIHQFQGSAWAKVADDLSWL